MSFSRTVCIPDLLSPHRAAADGFFDLVREPIRQGCGMDIGHAPWSRKPHQLLAGFDLHRYETLLQQIAPSAADSLWSATYHHLPEAAAHYLLDHVPPGALVLSAQLSPGLRKACEHRGVAFLDLRISPLRFGRDLYVALDTSHDVLRERIRSHAVSDEELRLEASLLGANLRAHRSRLNESARHFYSLDGALVYAWQPHWDKALLAADGHVLHVREYAERLRGILGDRRLLFLADYGDAHVAQLAEQERKALSLLLEKPVTPCMQNSYQILSAPDDVELTGINAPLLQEAAWFDKPVHGLADASTPLAPAHVPGHAGYLQVHFSEILAPEFWHQLLAPQAQPPKLARLPAVDRHQGRQLLDDWGDYEKVLHWERNLPWQAFERSGGTVLRRRIDSLEKQALSNSRSSPAMASRAHADDDMRSRIQALKDTKRGQTAYVLGNGPSLKELDIAKLMQHDTFWCNRAFELEKQGIAFKPTYYFLWDQIYLHKDADKVIGIDAKIKFFGPEAYNYANRVYPDACKTQDILMLTSASQTHGNFMYDSEANFSEDVSLLVYDGGSVLLSAIQMAFHMGYSRVLVGGVDLDYSKPYFYGSMHVHSHTNVELIADTMRKSFPVARRYFEKHGRTLCKITRSPHLPLDYLDTPDFYSNENTEM